jgi:hypothetical protein
MTCFAVDHRPHFLGLTERSNGKVVCAATIGDGDRIIDESRQLR